MHLRAKWEQDWRIMYGMQPTQIGLEGTDASSMLSAAYACRTRCLPTANLGLENINSLPDCLYCISPSLFKLSLDPSVQN